MNVAPAVATPVTPEITAPVQVVTTPAAVKATSTAAPSAAIMPVDDLRQMLQAAGLELASTDPVKLRTAQESTEKIVPVQRVPRERKPLPPASSEPLVLVETRR